MEKMIPISQAEALVQDLATQARIEEYDCATKLHAGDVEGAKLAAKRANIFRQAFLRVSKDILRKINDDNIE